MPSLMSKVRYSDVDMARIADLRNNHHMTFQALAKRFGLPERTLARYWQQWLAENRIKPKSIETEQTYELEFAANGRVLGPFVSRESALAMLKFCKDGERIILVTRTAEIVQIGGDV